MKTLTHGMIGLCMAIAASTAQAITFEQYEESRGPGTVYSELKNQDLLGLKVFMIEQDLAAYQKFLGHDDAFIERSIKSNEEIIQDVNDIFAKHGYTVEDIETLLNATEIGMDEEKLLDLIFQGYINFSRIESIQ
jgi:hypothetical protein